VYIKLVVLLRNYVTMMHGQQNIKNGWATIVVVGRLRVNHSCSGNATVCSVYVLATCRRQLYKNIELHNSALMADLCRRLQ
jgi:hypothetical protein